MAREWDEFGGGPDFEASKVAAEAAVVADRLNDRFCVGCSVVWACVNHAGCAVSARKRVTVVCACGGRAVAWPGGELADGGVSRSGCVQ